MDIHVIPLDFGDGEQFIIYRPVPKIAFIGNKGMVDIVDRIRTLEFENIDTINNDAITFLSEIGFLLPDPPTEVKQPLITNAVLLLTNQCQLRCIYCYAAAGEFTPQVLSEKSAKLVIDYVCSNSIKHAGDEFKVEFHGGGEPTLEWHTFQVLVDYVRKKPLKSNISLTSNAIWSVKQCEWIIDNIDFISISMDGSPSTQDRQRPFTNNHPSSPVVLRNIKMIDEYSVDYGIRMTASKLWDELFSDVKFILESTSCRSIQVEPAFDIHRGEHGKPGSDSKEFIDSFVDAYNLAKEYGASLSYSGGRPLTLTNVFCSAPYDALIINPEDNIVACYEITNSSHSLAQISTFGRIEGNNIILDEIKRNHFHSLLKQRFDSCKNCFCQRSCAGDCYTRAFGDGDGDYLYKGVRCEVNREITKYLLLDLIYENSGIWRGNKSSLDDEIYG